MEHTEKILSYAAGYLDGEGCFKFTNGTPVVAVDNTYVDTLMWLSEMFGGTCRIKPPQSNPKWRQAFSWAVSGDNARKCLKALLPYLQEKKPQAKILLEISSYPPRSYKRDQLHKELRKLKRIDRKWTRLNTYQLPHFSKKSKSDLMTPSSSPPQK